MVYNRRVTRSDIKRSLCLQGEVTTETGAWRLVRRLLPKSKWDIYTSGQTKLEIVTMVRNYPKGAKLWSLAHDESLHNEAPNHPANPICYYSLIQSLLLNNVVLLLCFLEWPFSFWDLYLCSHCSLCLQALQTSILTNICKSLQIT